MEHTTKETIYNAIAAHLGQSKGVIAVVQNNNKRERPNASQHRFLWNKAQILECYSGIKEFIEDLPNYGFTNGTILYLKRFEGSSAKKKAEIVLNFSKPLETPKNTQEPVNTSVTTSQQSVASVQTPQAPVQQMAAPQALAFAPIPQSELINMKVKLERFADLKDKANKLEQELSDCKSELRIEKEKCYAAEKKLETIIDKKEFEKEKALADKETAFDRLANNEAVVQGLGVFLGKLPDMLNKQPAQMGMGNPIAGYSQQKQTFIQMLKDTPDAIMPLLQNTLWAIINEDGFGTELQEGLKHIIPKTS